MRARVEMQALEDAVEIVDHADVIAVDVDFAFPRLDLQAQRAFVVARVGAALRIARVTAVPRIVVAAVVAVPAVVAPRVVVAVAAVVSAGVATRPTHPAVELPPGKSAPRGAAARTGRAAAARCARRRNLFTTATARRTGGDFLLSQRRHGRQGDRHRKTREYSQDVLHGRNPLPVKGSNHTAKPAPHD